MEVPPAAPTEVSPEVSTDRPGPPALGSPSPAARFGPLALGLAVFTVLALRANFLIDDAFISFRYARNWSELGVPSYNPGVEPPVEGYSNFLWVLILRLAYGAGWSLEIASRVISALAAAGCLVLLNGLLLRAGAGALARTAGLLALGASAPFAVWATGGLETALFALLLLSTFAAQAAAVREGASGRLRGAATGLLALALAVTRPEGALWVVGCAACARIARGAPARTRDLAHGITFALGFVLFLLWRRSVHGDWLPNTVHAKAGLSSETLARGARYVGTFLLLCPAMLLALAGGLLSGRLGLGLAGMLAGGLAYSAAAGGDWMPFFRFLAPVAPFVAWGIALAVADRPRVFAPLAAAAIAAGALPLYDVHPVPESVRESLDFRDFHVGYTSEWRRWEIGNQNLERFSKIGRAFAQVAAPDETIVFGAIGAVGWYSKRFIYDRNGLVDREVARLPSDGSTRSAGHDKRVPRAWFTDRRPTFYQALFVEGRIAGPDSPGFRKALGFVANKVFVQDPGEESLKDHCLPEALLLEEAPGIPAGSTLFVLRHTDDGAAARAFWGP